jgi:hypothetical protein
MAQGAAVRIVVATETLPGAEEATVDGVSLSQPIPTDMHSNAPIKTLIEQDHLVYILSPWFYLR